MKAAYTSELSPHRSPLPHHSHSLAIRFRVAASKAIIDGCCLCTGCGASVHNIYLEPHAKAMICAMRSEPTERDGRDDERCSVYRVKEKQHIRVLDHIQAPQSSTVCVCVLPWITYIPCNCTLCELPPERREMVWLMMLAPQSPLPVGKQNMFFGTIEITPHPTRWSAVGTNGRCIPAGTSEMSAFVQESRFLAKGRDFFAFYFTVGVSVDVVFVSTWLGGITAWCCGHDRVGCTCQNRCQPSGTYGTRWFWRRFRNFLGLLCRAVAVVAGCATEGLCVAVNAKLYVAELFRFAWWRRMIALPSSENY